MQGIPIIDKHDTDTDTKPDESEGCYDYLRKNLYFIGTSAVITKLLGFNEASWWLALLPFYILELIFIGILLLSSPFLIFHLWVNKDKKDPTESESKTDNHDQH